MGEGREVVKRGGGGKREKGALRAAQADNSSRDQRESSAGKAEVATKLPCTHIPHATCSMHSQLAVKQLPPPPLPSALLINCSIYVSGLRCDNLRQSCCAAGSSANRSAEEHVEQ